MTESVTGLHRVRTLAEKLREALSETGEPPNMDEFTPEERAQIRRTFPLYDSDEKLSAAIYFMAIATDERGRKALEWMLTFFLALVTIWDGVMVLIAVIKWMKTSIGQIVLAGAVIATFTLDRETVLKWLAALLK